jgi:hypothetical protein|tara:strand:+ start:2036 stop:2146 length:111 start_codon:yes stop_codon:yes gene_type:complete
MLDENTHDENPLNNDSSPEQNIDDDMKILEKLFKKV